MSDLEARVARLERIAVGSRPPKWRRHDGKGEPEGLTEFVWVLFWPKGVDHHMPHRAKLLRSIPAVWVWPQDHPTYNDIIAWAPCLEPEGFGNE